MRFELPPVYLGMLCACGDARRQAAEAMLADCYRRLGDGTRGMVRFEVTPDLFLTDVVRSLGGDLTPGYAITRIASDQWFVIEMEDSDDMRVSVQCDFLEHGLARLWLYAADRAAGRDVPGPMFNRWQAARALGLSVEQALDLMEAGVLDCVDEDGWVTPEQMTAFLDAFPPRDGDAG